jgi:hypothetical protein
VAAESGLSDGPCLRLLGDGRRVRVAFSYHKTGPSGRLAYVDIYDPAARGNVRPQTVRLPTDDQLEWAAGTAVQGGLHEHDAPITILDADGTLSPWRRPGRLPVAATSDVVVDAHRGMDSRKRGFQVLDRRTRRVLWSRRRQTVYAVSPQAIIAGHTRWLRLYDLRTGKVIARSNDPAKFPVTGHAAPLGVTTDGHAIALTGTFSDRALYALPPRTSQPS